MRNARVLVLVGALVAGLLAALLVIGGDDEPKTVFVEKGPQVAMAQVLVATDTLPLGKPLSDGDMHWVQWPVELASEGLIQKSIQPDAIEEFQGKLVRHAVFKGDPIRPERLVSSEGGYLSALLPKGKRALAVSVKPVTTAGGFILPGDKIDIILTRSDAHTDEMTSDIILQNIRVLAIDTVTAGNQDGATAYPERTATLELKPEETEIIAQAQEVGTLTLALRSVADSADSDVTKMVRRKTKSAVTFVRYGNVEQLGSGN
ncbi:Flp pilus assembly protein CpaB [Polycladidibacter stylochi]|uniref:Flp pilus assembly protein CpaB n=1 Tax=Polycladidibacter stylochi TaxID=1807766 RepID=UPI0008305981|nr:Flp pilus assembly protein CpaB [Pseudovibrio stylochi]